MDADPILRRGAHDAASGDWAQCRRRHGDREFSPPSQMVNTSIICAGGAGATKLAAAQQRLARTKRGSMNRAMAQQTVAARYRKIANQRRDFHHKLARQLVGAYDVIAVEDLAVADLLRRAKPVPDPDHPGTFLPNGAAAKAGLNTSISDAGWSQFISVLRAKAEDAGRSLIEVDPRHTSDGCENCGHAAKENRVTQSVFVCRACGHHVQADEHAARNILRAGLALHAHAA